MPVSVADQLAQAALGHLGLAGAESSDVVRRLLDMPADEFFKKTPPSHPIVPVIDDIIPEQVTMALLQDQNASKLPGAQRVESILLGDSKLDVSGFRKDNPL